MGTIRSDHPTLDARVYPAEESDGQSFVASDVNYVSFINGETYGVPALINEDRVEGRGLPVTVLYVNTDRVASVKVTRKS